MQEMAQPLVKKDDDHNDEVEYSPFYGIEKGAVLQEARVFNDPQLDPRRCSQVITKLLYLLNQGDTFTQGTEVVPINFRSHSCLLSGVFIGNMKVLVRLSFGIDGQKDVAMKLAVRSEDESIGDAIHEIVASG